MAESKKGCGKIMSYKVGENIRIEHPLKTEIYKKGYTIKSFSDLCGLNRNTFNQIFKGSKPRGDTVYIISNQLGLSYERIIKLCQ